MADIIGAASLELGVDLKPLQDGLDTARKLVTQFTGGASKDLGKALGAPAEQIARLTQVAKEAAKETASLRQLLNQAPGASFDKITSQVRSLRRELNGLRTASQEYVEALTRIRELEITRDRRVARQRVNADFEAFRGPTVANGAASDGRLPGLPNTVAADLQRLRELSQQLNNVDRGSAEYDITLRRLEATQRRVTQSLSGVSETYRKLEVQEESAIRRTQKLAAIQDYYASKNARAGGIRDENGAIRARGAGTVADERAYNAALRPARELLEADLRREQTLRRIGQRIVENARLTEGGFGAFSAGVGNDPIAKSIARNRRRQEARALREQEVRDVFEADLARVRERRLEIQSFAALRKPAPPPPIPGRLLNNNSLGAINSRNGAIGSALIGGFFPLLFGQGVGAAAGGGLGGLLGNRALGDNGGFAGGVVGTFFGAQVDAALQKLTALGDGLRDPVKNFDALREAALLSSRSVERNVESLIAVGRAEEAAAIARADLARLGSGPEISALINAQDQLKRTYSELGVGVARFTAGPLAALLRAINDGLGGGGGVGSQLIRSATEAVNPLGAAGAAIGRLFGPAGDKKQPLRETKQQVELEKQLEAIAARRGQVSAAEYRATLASAQGYRKLALERENEASVAREQQRVRDAQASGAQRPQRLAIVGEEQKKRRDNILEIQRLERDAAKEQRAADRENADRLATSRDELALAQRIASARGLSRTVLEEQNKVLGAGLERQRAFERLRSAELDPSVTAVQREKLRVDFQIAGDALNKAITEAGPRLVQFAKDAAKQLRDAQLSAAQARLGLNAANTNLAATRTGPGGIGQFLNGAQNQQLQNSTLRNLIPTFFANVNNLRATLSANGVTNPNDSLQLESLIQRVQSFGRGDFNDGASVSALINDVIALNTAVQNDTAAQQNLTAANNALRDATEALRQATVDNSTAQSALAQSVTTLANKDWNVYVQPPLTPVAAPGGLGI